MDQVVVDLDGDEAAAGDEVVMFGDARRGHPTASDWADACGTIGYEIVTRLGPRCRGSRSEAPAQRRRSTVAESLGWQIAGAAAAVAVGAAAGVLAERRLVRRRLTADPGCASGSAACVAIRC